MMEPPRLIFGIAHHEPAKAQRALRECLVCSSQHPAIRELQSGAVAAEARHFAEGDIGLEELPLMLEFVSSLTFAYSCERAVEGDHASVHRACSRARYRREAFDSLVRRMPEIRDVLARPDGLQELASFVLQARNPRKVVETLGMRDHISYSQAVQTVQTT